MEPSPQNAESPAGAKASKGAQKAAKADAAAVESADADDARALRDKFFNDAAEHSPLVAVETPHGFFLVSTTDGNVGRSLFLKRTRGEFRALQRGMSALEAIDAADRARSGLFIDVGANIGTSTVSALTKFGFEQGVALEPEPNNHFLLSINIAANRLSSRVRTLQTAVSNESGTAKLQVSPNKSGGHELRTRGGKKKGQAIEVDLVSLDKLANEGFIRADGSGLIWIDTQGAEGQVLQGATALTRAGTPIILEIAPRLLGSHEGVDPLTAVASEHYTHLIEFGASDRGQLQPVGGLAELIERYAEQKSITDIMLVRAPERA